MTHLLSTSDMARFVARGYLEFPGIVPSDVNALYLEQLAAGTLAEVNPGAPLSAAYPETSAIAAFVRTPAVAGIIESLVGPDPIVDHHFAHVAPSSASRSKRGKAGPPASQHWHQDSTIDTRRAFDVQLMWYPHAVEAGMGGTRFLPGSHLRIVSEAAIGRYQNIVGQKHMVCEAGTVLALHHGIWHGGGSNQQQTDRQMFKLRLGPRRPQVRLWDVSDLEARQGPQQPIFWRTRPRANDDLHDILMEPQPWYEADTGRLEMIGRIRLWRYLTGDPRFDADYWLGRLENQGAAQTWPASAEEFGHA